MKKAFTLSEVLITLGIIGAVAVLTMSILIKNYQVKTTVVKLKKMYSILSEAYAMYLNENVPLSSIPLNSSGAVVAFKVFEPNLKILKDCGVSSGKGCIYTGVYKERSGAPRLSYSQSNFYYKALLVDGSAIWFRGSVDGYYQINIFYDVNGEKGPNRWGYDLFGFLVNEKEVFPLGARGKDLLNQQLDKSCSSSGSSGFGCTAWVLEHENMDYLK